MQRRPLRNLKFTIAALFFGLIVLYALYETRDIIQGPQITIESPRDGSTATSSVVTVNGTAKNISHLSFNGRQIYTDTTGVFSEKLLVPEGYTILELKAADRFNREVVKHVRIIRNDEDRS